MLPLELEPVAAVGAPALAAGVLAGIAWMQRKQPQGTSLGWAGTLVALGLAGSVFLLRGWPGFPPANLHSWPLFIAGGAALLALAAHVRLAWFAAASLLFIGAALPVLLTVPLRSWSVVAAAAWFAVFGLAWLALLIGARGTAGRLPVPSLAAWAGALAVTGWLIADPVTAKHHGFCLAGAGVAAGLIGLANLRWGGRIGAPSVAVALAAMVPVYLLLAHTLTANLPAIAMVPLVVAPLTAWAAYPLRARPWTAAVVAFVVAAAVAASAILLVSAPPPAAEGW